VSQLDAGFDSDTRDGREARGSAPVNSRD
jgi:hypothetical protein